MKLIQHLIVLIRAMALLVSVAVAGAVDEDPMRYDVVVYGGTSGGVTAAVQAARSGKRVVLISPTSHLGGLTSSGLGWTDLGKSSILGGISREFYHRVYQHYQDDAAWNWQSRTNYGNNGQGGPAFNANTEIASVFEPKVAEKIFLDLLADEEVPVITGRLDLEGGVVMDGLRIDAIKLEGGAEYLGKMFIDASYEGDLLPGAGVTFTVGREANATYNESVNGIQAAMATKNQLPDHIDPYVVSGDASSGRLPGVEADSGAADGSSDLRLQAYCYRMVLTDVEANRVMIARPANYQEADYELLFRAIEAGQTSGFFKFDLMPNRKTDSNNHGGISTDLIGGNYGPGWDWTTLGHDGRLALARKHEQWQRGLVWTLQNHPRVPQSIRQAYGAWGLPADEFTDHNHWPYQIYVREARRLVSDYVMTQQHCTGVQIASDSIGLAAYSMDSHNTQRHVKNGMVKNEGDVQLTVPNAYPVSYRSIIPKHGECTNLLVPWSLSASHMAFGSIRMEPVFMILAQSAAIAADIAIDQEVDVQDVAYPQLREEMLGAGQALGEPVIGMPTNIVDNSDSELVAITGNWISGNSTAGFMGADYLHNDNTGQGEKEVRFGVPDASPGIQAVFLRWTEHPNRASKVVIEIRHVADDVKIDVDQRSNGGKWNLLGMHSFTGDAGEGVTIKTDGADGYIIADAVGFLPLDENADHDGDGLGDLDELLLGLNPFASDKEFFAAVAAHPHVFGLHSASEIEDLHMLGISMQRAEDSAIDLQISLDRPDWEMFETIDLTTRINANAEFFRLNFGAKP